MAAGAARGDFADGAEHVVVPGGLDTQGPVEPGPLAGLGTYLGAGVQEVANRTASAIGRACRNVGRPVVTASFRVYAVAWLIASAGGGVPGRPLGGAVTAVTGVPGILVRAGCAAVRHASCVGLVASDCCVAGGGRSGVPVPEPQADVPAELMAEAFGLCG